MHKAKKKNDGLLLLKIPHIQITSPFADWEQIKSFHWSIATDFLISQNLFFPPLFKSHTACFEYYNALTCKIYFSPFSNSPSSSIFVYLNMYHLYFHFSLWHCTFLFLCPFSYYTYIYTYFPKICLPPFLSSTNCLEKKNPTNYMKNKIHSYKFEITSMRKTHLSPLLNYISTFLKLCKNSHLGYSADFFYSVHLGVNI